jgi:hypothetical protein
MTSPIIQKIIQQLKKANLSLEDRTALTTALLDKLQALPLSNTFIVGQGKVIINGKELETEQAISFVESCNALKDNYARKIIHEQIKYLAINLGIHNCLSLDTMMFAKAALWCLQQQEELLEKII